MGKIADDEMRSVFNLGIGLVAVISKDILNDVKSYLDSINEQYYLVGKIV